METRRKHGVAVGRKYLNDFSIGVFIDYIGDDLKQQLSSETVKTKFYGVLCDGSMDANTIENKVKCKLWWADFYFVVT